MCYQMLFCITLFINQWLIAAISVKDWSTQYRNYDKEFHILTRREGLKLHEFSSPSTKNFTTLYFYNGSLLVGARNAILVMNTTTSIENITKIFWTPPESEQRDFCLQTGTPEDECYNFIKILAVSDNKLFTCGTNSHYPSCVWREVNTFQILSGTSRFSSQAFVNANPHTKATYTFSDDGRFFSTAAQSSGGNDKTIVNTEFRNFRPRRLLYIKRNDPYWLNDPAFHQIFPIGKYVYFFFDEFGFECADCDPVRYSRVARICKGDNGGSSMINWVNFATFQKARLNCSTEGNYRYHFNVMRDMYWDPQTAMFYGIFSTMNGPSEYLSAICSYSLSEIEKVFSGKVKHKKGNVWKKRKKPGHINECTVNPRSIFIPTSRKSTRMKTKTMKMSALQELNQCIYASDVAQSSTKTTPFYLDNIRFLKVLVLSFNVTLVLNSHNNSSSNNKGVWHTISVWYIVTERSTILKLGKIPNSDEVCIFEEYDIFPKNEREEIKAMALSPKKDYFLIGTNSKLIRLSITNCGKYSKKSSCLAAQDPLCGWSAVENKCLGWDKRNNNSWEQNFTSCKERLQRPAEWSDWSSWFECKNSDGNLCKCRRRKCVYARPSYQCEGEDNELTNCTVDVSTLTNKEQWWIYGVIHGGWSNWSTWSECLRGYKNRSRTCTNPVPANGGLPCSETNMEYTLCEPTRFDDANITLWTSWTRVRGPKRKVTRYRISCTSKSVVMKSLQINVLRNETKNCTKELCVDPPKVKKEQRILTNWSSWLYCNDTTEKLRTRHFCIKNSSSYYWTCSQFGVESMERPVTTTASRPSTVEPTMDLTTLGSTTNVASSETSTTKMATTSPTTPTTKEESTSASTANVGCRVTTSGTTPNTITSSDDSSSTPIYDTPSTTTENVATASTTTENVTTSSFNTKDTTITSTIATETNTGKPDILERPPEWSQWSVCLCDHDVVLANRSRGIQHRTLEQERGIQAEYRTCSCKARHTTTNPADVLNVKVKHFSNNDDDVGEYSLTMLIIVVSICSLICIIITIIVAVVWQRRKSKSEKLSDDSKSEKSKKQYLQVNGITTTTTGV